MKHLIETADSSSLATVPYDRIVLDTTTNEIVCKGGGYEYVDLGLPSGLKWAKCNVGAETETDYGDYFQWGETTTDTDYTWATYKYCNGSDTTMTKYCTDSRYGTVDNITTLEPVDDAASQIMGGKWRMPTEAEFDELLNGTTNKWVTNYNGTGVNGRKFTSKTNSNSIFIPSTSGNNGYVWSSSLSTSSPSDAMNLFFFSPHCGVSRTYRRNIGSVRGVFK